MTVNARTAASGQRDPDRDGRRQALYAHVCESYQAIDDFRMKLLGLLPVATGTGVFLLLSNKAEVIGTAKSEDVRGAMAAIGALGLLFTLGLFAFELFGIAKCHYLIEAGRRLERDLDIRGQFRSRPFDVAGFVNEPFASGVVYPVSMAAWVYLAFVFVSSLLAALLAFAVLVAGFGAMICGSRRIGRTHDREEQVFDAVQTHGPVSVRDLRALTGLKQAWLSQAVRRLQGRGELEEDDGLMRVAGPQATSRLEG